MCFDPGTFQMERREQLLVAALSEFLEAQGHTVVRLQLHPGETVKGTSVRGPFCERLQRSGNFPPQPTSSDQALRRSQLWGPDHAVNLACLLLES